MNPEWLSFLIGIGAGVGLVIAVVGYLASLEGPAVQTAARDRTRGRAVAPGPTRHWLRQSRLAGFMTVLEHYADSFSPQPDRCFRLVCRPDAEGQPIHCQAPVSVRGTFLALNKLRYAVESCEGHKHDLVNLRPR